jgi:hypothetical protein
MGRIKTVEIKGRKYDLKFNNRAKYRVSLFGDAYNTAGPVAQFLMTLHALIQAKNPPSPEDLADAFDDDEEAMLSIQNDVIEVLGAEDSAEGEQGDPLPKTGPSSASKSASRKKNG